MAHQPIVTITEAEYEEAESELAGVCCECGELVNHGSVEADAEGYECEACGEAAVMGVPNALLQGLVDVGPEHVNHKEGEQ